MNFRNISCLVSEAANGKDNLPKGTVGCAGYGFLFRDIRYIERHLQLSESGKLFSIGAMRAFLDHKINFGDYLERGRHIDIILAGAIKTLVPKLKFGDGFESLFNVWLFVKTSSGKTFPLTLYYGQSGLAISGCDPGLASLWIDKGYDLTKEFKAIVNLNPHDLIEGEMKELVEALEIALQKVPLTDFYGMYKHDFGNLIMGIKNGKPLLVELGISPEYSKEESFLNQELKLGVSQKEFKRWNRF